MRKYISFLASVFLLLSAAVQSVYAEKSVAPVRVGYYENGAFQQGAEPGAIRRGYAYEYYRKLSEYTGWQYEYVYGGFSDLYQMLLDGQIDLLAGLAKTEERLGVVGYPEFPMGSETYNMMKHSEDDRITTSYTTVNGFRANDLLKNRQFRELSLKPLNQPDYRAFGVRIGEEGLLRLLNRGVNLIGRDRIEAIAYRYIEGIYSRSLLDMIMDNLWILGLLIAAAALLAVAFFARESSLTKRRMEEREAASASLLSLVNDILDFSKIEAGKMEIIPVEYEISSVLNDLVKRTGKTSKRPLSA